MYFNYPFNSKNLNAKQKTIKQNVVRFLVFILFFILLLAKPANVNAGIISFVSDLFSNQTKDEFEEKTINSQNIALLHTTASVNLNSTIKNEDTAIVSDTSLLSETGPSGTIADISEPSFSGQISIYVVREGDTLSDIAKMFNVTINTIVWANEIKGGKLQIGQTLAILPVPGIKYTIKSGDTVKSVAKKFKADVEEIINYNNLSSGILVAVGQDIIIPDAEIIMTSNTLTPPKTDTKKKPPRGTNGPVYEGYYLKPVNIGRRSQGLHGYNGIDFAAPIGTPIYSSAPGVILISKTEGWNGGYAQYIVIQHDNGTQTLYGHLSKNYVSSGVAVSRGEIIGAVGNTGNSTGPHLHFEIRGAHNPF